MVKHLVLWKVKGDAAARRQVVEALRGKMNRLCEIIPDILECRVGENVHDGDCFQMCVDMRFETMEALERYGDQPDHVLVKQYLNENTYEKEVFDYVM